MVDASAATCKVGHRRNMVGGVGQWHWEVAVDVPQRDGWVNGGWGQLG